MIRRRRSDGEATRAQLLETAGTLIVEQGFAHTTNKAIAEKAGVDLATINYHFGGRAGLYQAVLAEGHRHFIDIAALAALDESDLEPRAKLASILEQVMVKLMKEPGWQAQVFISEVVAPSINMEDFFQTVIMPKEMYLRKILHQITKIPEDDLAIQRCMMSIMAPLLLLLVSGNGTPNPMQQLKEVDGYDELVKHHLRFSLAGLDAISEEYHGKTKLGDSNFGLHGNRIIQEK